MTTRAEPLTEAEGAGEVVLPKPTKSPRRFIFFGLAGVVILAGVGWYVSRMGHETTDDAQVDGDVISVPARTGGVVTKVFFTDNQSVKANEPLAELDGELPKARLLQAEANLAVASAAAVAADAEARLAETNAKGNKTVAQATLAGAASGATATKEQVAEAEAQVTSAQASFDRAKSDFDRAKSLFDTKAIPQAQLDQARANNDTAQASLGQSKAHLEAVRASTSQAYSRIQEASARVEQTRDVDVVVAQARAKADGAHAQVAFATATRDLAALDVAYTHILAPQDGVVSKRAIAVGQQVSAGQPIVQLVPTAVPWITANFKETQIAKMRVGQPVDVTVDAFPGHVFHGELDSFAGAAGNKFSLLPADNASGNFTKVVQRMTVRVKLLDAPKDLGLRPGMNAEVDVDIRK
jgi:membrane fusion protein (multidrug efflux system)